MFTLWWQACRPKTLLISVAVIVLGNALLPWSQLSVAVALLSLATALLLQTAVNLANDYFDAASGVDGPQRLGPVRAIQAGLLKPRQVRNAMLLFLLLALLCGIWLLLLAPYGGGLFWLAGALSLLAVLAYSAGPWPLASNALGEVTVFVFFGLLGVGGSYYLQSGELPLRVYLAGCQLGALTAAVMLVNNTRDRLSDAAAGKRTLAVMLGEQRARCLYALLVLFPGMLQLLLMQGGGLLSALLMCVFGVLLAVQGFRVAGQEFNRLLGQTVLACAVCTLLIIAAERGF